jgi:hypothetical protein
MLAIVFFQESRSVLVELDAVENPPAVDRITAALAASGYEETPSSFVLLASGQDVVIGEVETLPLADLAETWVEAEINKGNTMDDGGLPKFIEETDLDGGVWAPSVPAPLADLIEAAEAAAFPEGE